MKYSAKFKLQVVNFADKTNNCAASRKFGVNEKLVRDWKARLIQRIYHKIVNFRRILGGRLIHRQIR